MDAWIEFARGPLFRIALTVMLLGLAYRVVVTAAQITASWYRAGDRRLPLSEIFEATVKWLFPVRLLRTRPVYSAASFLFHLGVVLVPLFLIGHVALLDTLLPAAWPVLPPLVADALTVIALAALLGLLVGRTVTRSARVLSRTQDVVLLLILFATLLFGFLSSHPAASPWASRSMLLLHILLGDLVLVLVPTTKIAHCALYPLTQLLFQLGWHFPAESGRHVAHALAKENEPV
jgi:nitrate reductase gamma subunit